MQRLLERGVIYEKGVVAHGRVRGKKGLKHLCWFLKSVYKKNPQSAKGQATETRVLHY